MAASNVLVLSSWAPYLFSLVLISTILWKKSLKVFMCFQSHSPTFASRCFPCGDDGPEEAYDWACQLRSPLFLCFLFFFLSETHPCYVKWKFLSLWVLTDLFPCLLWRKFMLVWLWLLWFFICDVLTILWSINT